MYSRYACTYVYLLSYRSGQTEEVCSGITGYFNAMLGSQLLYKFERPQYEEVSVCKCVPVSMCVYLCSCA